MMRVAARKFAVLLWVGAAIVAVGIWMTIAATPYAYNVPAGPYRQQLYVSAFVSSLTYSGLLVVLGTVIYLLGEIRDRLVRQSAEDNGDAAVE